MSTAFPDASMVRPATFVESARLNSALGARLILASETFQVTGSFKFRAAYHVASRVSQKLLIAASSGNFGQALSYACALTGKSCIIVMPSTAARIKVDAVREFGGEVQFVDTRVTSRKEIVARLATEHPEAYIASSADDPLVIAGNSSLGIELSSLRDVLDSVIAPIGGGGLTSGIIAGLRQSGASTPVIAAEPLIANDAARSLREGRIVSLDTEPPTIADGARVLSVGKHNWKILQHGLADVIEVPEDKIVEGVRLLFLRANLKVEPTAALGIAAILTQPERFQGQTVCCVISGGNVDPASYAKLIVQDS
ncbi:MAG: threonine ammonia-lyase [Candidatus Acidiferrales bacterium]